MISINKENTNKMKYFTLLIRFRSKLMSFSEDSLYTFVKPVVYIDIQSDVKYTEDILRILTLKQ